VTESIFFHKGFEVHLIDTPGFDDNHDGLDDSRILKDIADTLNFRYRDGFKLSHALYLHDITKSRMGASGEKNIRLLEELLGADHWDGCTLVTTKWGCTNDPAREAAREEELERSVKFWKPMRTGEKRAAMKRFDNTRESALELIEPYLGEGFVPQLTYEMADPHGPRRALGATGAGQHISEFLNRFERQKGKTLRTERARRELQQEFNEEVYAAYVAARKRLETQMKINRGFRWAIRLSVLGGCIAATVITIGAASPAFAAVGVIEPILIAQKESDRKKMERLSRNYHSKVRHVVLEDSLDSLGRLKELEFGKSLTSLYTVETEGMNVSEESLIKRIEGKEYL
jgi:hypothetical protein